MLIKNNQLSSRYQYLSAVISGTLSLEEIKKLRDARKNIKEKLDEYLALRKEVFAGYGVKSEPELLAHPQKEEIQQKVKQLDNEETEFTGLKFLKEETVLAVVPKTANQNDIDILIDLLAK